MSDYQPGTVAWATVRGQSSYKVMRVVTSRGPRWASTENDAGQFLHEDDDVTDIRPLVVLDPEDEAVRTFVRKHRDGTGNPACGYSIPIVEAIEAQTKPPRIPEPGPWGVVEATFKNGRARHGWAVRRLTDGDHDWQDGAGDYHRWDELIDPVLIREGVES
jgi:hypothetical protein